MLIGDMDISMLTVYVQQVEEENLSDKDEYRNKKAMTGNASGQQKNDSSRQQFQKPKRNAPLSASAPPFRNIGEYDGQNLRT